MKTINEKLVEKVVEYMSVQHVDVRITYVARDELPVEVRP